MNEPRVIAALLELSEATRELAEICEREALGYGPMLRRLSSNARALTSELTREDVESVQTTAASLYASHPGSFSEVYIARTDPAEREAENARFERVKDRVASAIGDIARATVEGEINFGAVRRHLTSLETELIQANRPNEVARIRDLLDRDPKKPADVLALIDELEARVWPESLRATVQAHISAVRRELVVD
jgi:hypothetical protein